MFRVSKPVKLQLEQALVLSVRLCYPTYGKIIAREDKGGSGCKMLLMEDVCRISDMLSSPQALTSQRATVGESVTVERSQTKESYLIWWRA